MQVIKLFLASPFELKNERDKLELYISNKNNSLTSKNIHIELIRWENLSAFAPWNGRTQDSYNEEIKESDLFVLLLRNKVGKYSKEEFEHAIKCHKINGKPTYAVYLLPPESDKEEPSLNEFKTRLKELDFFSATFDNIEQVWIKLNSDLDLYISTLTPPQNDPPNSSPKINISYNIGDIITFGKYERNPIQWRICELRDNNKWAYLLSKDILLEKAYNIKFEAVTWETCTLRTWLNKEFLSNFTQEEQSAIGIQEIRNDNNQWYRTKGGNFTTDRIFLPSIWEIVDYFGDSGDLKNKKKYDNTKGYHLNDNGTYLHDRYDNERMAYGRYGSGSNLWWLRSPGYTNPLAARINSDGSIHINGGAVDDVIGVCPALWLNLEDKA